MTRKLIVATLAALVLIPAAPALARMSTYNQSGVRHGGHYLRPRAVAAHFGLTLSSMSTGSMRCYGYDGWKKGENATGLVIWSLHNKTYWCGVPGSHIVKGDTTGEARTWTGIFWESRDKSWTRHRDPLHPRKGRITEASATFAEGAGGYDVFSETVSRRYHVYANGAVR